MKFDYKRYPDQMLCFLLGFVPTAIWVCWLAVEVDVCLNSLAGKGLSSVPILAVKTFSYGIPGGVLGLLVGYWLRMFDLT